MKTALITGANRGVGLALAKLYSDKGYKVYATCRRASSELLEVKNVTVIEGIEVTKKESLSQMQKVLEGVKLDILINNAGVLLQDELGNIKENSLRIQFEVNSIAPLMVTMALIPHFKEGTKIGIVTSRMGSVSDNTSGGFYGYRASKAAANAIGKSLAVDLKEQKVAVALLHPGYVQTDMTGGTGEITADISAHGLYQVMEELSLEKSGGFWHTNGELLPF